MEATARVWDSEVGKRTACGIICKRDIWKPAKNPPTRKQESPTETRLWDNQKNQTGRLRQQWT